MSSFKTYWPQSDEENWRWSRAMADQIWPDEGRDLGKCQCMLTLKDDEIRAIHTFHNWDPQSGVIEMSGASDGYWMTKATLNALFWYAFDFAKCQLLIQRNDPDNEHLNRQMRRYGYTEYRIHRGRGRNKDELLFTLTDDQWRNHPYTRKYHGQKQRTLSAVS